MIVTHITLAKIGKVYLRFLILLIGFI